MQATIGKETRLAGLARDFSATVSAASTRISQAQKVIIEKTAAKASADERALKRRIGLARGGLRRLLAFGASPALKRIVKTMSRMHNNRIDVEFFALRWTWIGGQSHTSFGVSFETDGVRLGTFDSCWVARSKTFLVSYTGQEVLYEEILGNRTDKKSTYSLDGFLEAIATLERVDFADLSAQESPNLYQEENVIFQVLISWARNATFEQAVTDCLQHLEQALERVKLRAA